MVRLLGRWWQRARTKSGTSRFVYFEEIYRVRWTSSDGPHRERIFTEKLLAEQFIRELCQRAGGEWSGGQTKDDGR